MSRRPYRLAKRAETASATRRRILEATMNLHDEQGILATSIRDVAARAGVSPATVLRHFPVMDELIAACGQLTEERYPIPGEAVLEGAIDREDGVRRVALAFFRWWGREPKTWHNLEADRGALPQLDGWLRNIEAQRRALIRRALGSGADATTVSAVAALTSQGAWQSLRDDGMTEDEAADQVARFVERGVG